MLYKRWQQVVAANKNSLALTESDSGRRWTFGELHAHAEAQPEPCGNLVFPQGHDANFIVSVLVGWRTRKIVCPLEVGQAAPGVSELPNGCVHLKTTSATTGNARMAAFTAAQLAADADNIIRTMGLREDWPNLGVISLAHSYGFSNLVLPLLLHGIPLILCSSPLPEAVRRASCDEPALTLPAVPAMWRAWQEAGAIGKNVRLAISAGAPLSVQLERAVFAATGLKIHNFYGSTECGGIAFDASETPREDDALAGSPMLGVSLSIADNGCLVVESKAVGETYWPERSDALSGGRFRTSDLAELNDGKVFLRGRASDVINVAGRKVSPSVIEQQLFRHPAIHACLVFGVPARDAARGDVIVACAVKTENVTVDELRQFLAEKLPAWQMPREWWFVESLSTNRVGKISRAEWRRRFLEQRGDVTIG